MEKQPRFLLSIFSFYILSITVLFLFPRKVIEIPFFGVIPVTILLTGFHILLLDVISEIYGYRMGRKALYNGIYFTIALGIISTFIIHLPSPLSFNVSWAPVQDPSAFEYIFGHAYLLILGLTIGSLVGDRFNIYLLSKWSFLTKGRHFWLRSLAASSIDAFILSFTSIIIVGWFGIKKFGIVYLFKIIMMSFFAKLIVIAILATPASFLCLILKKAEGLDAQNNFNPFK